MGEIVVPPGAGCQNRPMQRRGDLGATAFVLAGGGTKGSFEIGVLQYLVGVEGIVPDIISATSAGAIVATVLAQARTAEEFADRVDEIERDLLAWSESEHVFGKQPWLRALEGTALGVEIDREVTRGTRPPFPLTPAHLLATNDAAPSGSPPDREERRHARRARWRRRGRMVRLAGGAALRLPRVHRHLPRRREFRAHARAVGPRLASRHRGRGPRRGSPRSSAVPGSSSAWPSRRSGPASCAS